MCICRCKYHGTRLRAAWQKAYQARQKGLMYEEECSKHHILHSFVYSAGLQASQNIVDDLSSGSFSTEIRTQ